MSEPKLKSIIRDYLSDTDLKETLRDSKLEVGPFYIKISIDSKV